MQEKAEKAPAKAKKEMLTDKRVKALKPAPAGKRPIIWDIAVPSFGVRSSDKGFHSYGIVSRFGGSKNPAWRTIGDVRTITLADARETARAWLKEGKEGKDPSVIREEKRIAEERQTKAIFSSVVEDFLREYVYGRKQRQARVVERRIRNEVLPHWADRSVHDIKRDDVEDLIRKIAERPAPRYAHGVLDDIKMFFNWCVDVADSKRAYKMEISPCYRIKPVHLIGKKNIRQRVLEDHELRAVWKVADEIGYPLGKLVQTIMLTGCRVSEVVGARRSELNGTTWTIPAERFKTDTPHRVPITPELAKLLASLPVFQYGDFLFSARFGKAPLNGPDKSRFDARLPKDMPQWCLHDLRRTVRTRLSPLAPDHVCEMCIGHGRKGMQKLYDHHKYEDPIREAMTAWTEKLRRIVEPAENVLELKPKVSG
jgi:integrase